MSFSANLPGYVICDGKCLPHHGTSARAVVSHYASPRFHKFSLGTNILPNNCLVYDPRRPLLACNASSNSGKTNSDLPRQSKGFSRGKGRQYHGQESSEDLEENDLLSSKNVPLLSLSSNQRHQATATSGRSEQEIVELFRKIQAQLRKQAAIKEEKKIEAAQQGQSEKGTVDSLLKLLRKHSVEQVRKSSSREEEDCNEQNPDFFESRTITDEACVPEPAPISSRPASNFRQRTPVPRVKFQPVFSADEDESSTSSLKPQGKTKNSGTVVPNDNTDHSYVIKQDVQSNVESDELSLEIPLDSSDIDETPEVAEQSSVVENTDLSSLRLSELRDIAKSRGVKGYSKLKKWELVELLSRDDARE